MNPKCLKYWNNLERTVLVIAALRKLFESPVGGTGTNSNQDLTSSHEDKSDIQFSNTRINGASRISSSIATLAKKSALV